MRIPRIKTLEPLPGYRLLVQFDEGTRVMYDVGADIRAIRAFEELRATPGLFENAQLDTSRTCIVWNERVDLPSDAILEHGVPVP